MRERLVRLALGATLGSLAVAGASTALLMAGLRWSALDDALDDAVRARMSAGMGAPLTVEASVDGDWPAAPRVDVEVSAGFATEVVRWTSGGRRWLRVPVEEFDLPGQPLEENHQIVTASAPLSAVWSGVPQALAAYLAVSLGIAALLRWRVDAAIDAALTPLARAEAQARRIADAVEREEPVPEGIPRCDDPDLVGVLDATDRLVAAMERSRSRLRTFAGVAAHELKTPLASMRGNAEITLRRPRDADTYRARLEGIVGDVDRLNGMLDALLALVRLSEGALALPREHAGDLARDAFDGPVDVRDDREVRAHPVLLRLALDNLVRNARAHAGGATRLATEPHAAGVAFVVEDAGPGVAPGLDPFAPLARAPTSPGHGLGLALVREIARVHGGLVLLSPRAGGGTRGALVLPVAG